MPEHDLVDIACGNTGIGECFGRHLHHQALDGFRVELPEWRMRPSHDAGYHGRSPCSGSDDFVAYREKYFTPVSAISWPAHTWLKCPPSCRNGYLRPGKARSRRP